MKGGVPILLGMADNETEDSASMIGERKKKQKTLRNKSRRSVKRGGVVVLGMADNETEDSASMIGERKKKQRTLRNKGLRSRKSVKRGGWFWDKENENNFKPLDATTNNSSTLQKLNNVAPTSANRFKRFANAVTSVRTPSDVGNLFFGLKDKTGVKIDENSEAQNPIYNGDNQPPPSYSDVMSQNEKPMSVEEAIKFGKDSRIAQSQSGGKKSRRRKSKRGGSHKKGHKGKRSRKH